MIDGLAGVKNDRGTVVFMCARCHVAPSQAFGAQNKDQLVYVLMCEKCGRFFGEWLTPEARDNELREFAKRVELLTS